MKKYIVQTFLIGVVIFGGCRENLLEEDISGKRVAVNSPSDHDTVSTTTPLFWWNKLDGARNYHLQIVYPDFYSPQTLLYDTLVNADRFYPVLNAGMTYSWRIRAENSVYKGDWVLRTLTIDSSVSLNSQSLIIISPANNGFSSSSAVVSFTWNAISNASLYRIEIINTASGSTVVSATTTVANYVYTFPQGNYSFNVRAENGTSVTPWSVRTFSIDQTAPVAPQLVSPANNTFYSSTPSTVNFDWTDAADAITDSLYISTDSSFASGIQVAALLNASQNNYSWTGAQASTIYFWRVRSMDAAGNRSSYSTIFRFTDN
jgi:hypothetical protein